jgi:polygalacturonase
MFSQGAPPSNTAFDIRSFGATGDGQTIDSDAINRAIDAASAAGGGTVYFPAGIYASYSIHLRNHIALYLEHGATLLAATPALQRGYDPAEPGAITTFQDYGHSHWHNSLIWGDGIEDVSILGPGRIDGRGLSRSVTTESPGVGNKAIAIVRGRHITIRDVTIYRAGHFALLATGVDDVTIDNVIVDSNRDGIDLDDCRNVRVSNAVVNTPLDDAIVLKTSFALDAQRTTENVTISNSVVSGYAVGSVLDGTYQPQVNAATNGDGPTGRIKLGTESNGAFRNIAISNVVFDHSRGLAIESVDGANIENIVATNLTMQHVSTAPIVVRLGSRMRGPANLPIGSIRRVVISNVIADDADSRYPITIAGIPGHPVEDVRLTNIQIVYRGGLTMSEAANQPAKLVRSSVPGIAGPRRPFAVPEQEAVYPEPSMFGVLPSSALYVRHVGNVMLDGVQVRFQHTDTRPRFVIEDAQQVEFHRVDGGAIPMVPTFVLHGVKDFYLGESSLSDRRLKRVDNDEF